MFPCWNFWIPNNFLNLPINISKNNHWEVLEYSFKDSFYSRLSMFLSQSVWFLAFCNRSFLSDLQIHRWCFSRLKVLYLTRYFLHLIFYILLQPTIFTHYFFQVQFPHFQVHSLFFLFFQEHSRTIVR